jgi:hypothetical protein
LLDRPGLLVINSLVNINMMISPGYEASSGFEYKHFRLTYDFQRDALATEILEEFFIKRRESREESRILGSEDESDPVAEGFEKLAAAFEDGENGIIILFSKSVGQLNMVFYLLL